VSPVHGDESWLKGVELIRTGRNLGFAAANNLAAAACPEAMWIALLNPDTIPTPDWLQQLERVADAHPEFTSFASQLISMEPPERLDGAGDGLTLGGRDPIAVVLAGQQRLNGNPVRYFPHAGRRRFTGETDFSRPAAWMRRFSVIWKMSTWAFVCSCWATAACIPPMPASGMPVRP
jgi:Predicted glycosyltransferases